jgi:hypothetical protein
MVRRLQNRSLHYARRKMNNAQIGFFSIFVFPDGLGVESKSGRNWDQQWKLLRPNLTEQKYLPPFPPFRFLHRKNQLFVEARPATENSLNLQKQKSAY